MNGFQYDAFDVTEKPQTKQTMATAPRGGVDGFLRNAVKGIVDPFLTMGKGLAYTPAAIGRILQNKPLYDLQKKAFGTTDQADIAKKIVGSTVGVGTTIAAPGASSIGKAATIGAVTGGASALTQDDSDLEDVLTGATVGGVTGGAIKGAGGVLSKLAKTPNPVKGTSNMFSREGSGLKVGPGVGDINRLDEAAEFMKRFPGKPKTQLRKLDVEMAKLGQEVDAILTATPYKLSGKTVSTRLQKAAEDLTDEKFYDLDLNNPAVSKILDRWYAKFDKVDEAKGINDLVKTLNSTAVRARDKLYSQSGTPLTAQETAALALKRAGDDVLSTIEDIAPLKRDMAMIFDINPQIANASEKGIGMPFTQGFTIKSPIQGLKAVQSRTGSLLNRNTKKAVEDTSIVDKEVSDAFGLIPRLLRQGATSGAGITATQQPTQQEVDVNSMVNEPDTMSEQQVDGGLQFGTSTPEQEDTDPFSVNNIRNSAQQILAQGGDMKDVAEFLNVAKTLQDLSSPAKKELTATQATRAAAAQNALNDIPLLKEAIDSGKLGGAKALPGSGTQIGRRVLGTENLDAALFNIADNILRARSGAAAPEAEVKRFVETFLPSATDSAKAKKQKLERAVRELQGFVDPQAGSADTLEEMVIQ